MLITLPDHLQKEIEELARREGVDLEILVIRAVERFLREQTHFVVSAADVRGRLMYERRKTSDSEILGESQNELTPRQRLRELSRRKLTIGEDSVDQIRLAKARAYQRYLDNEEWFELSARG